MFIQGVIKSANPGAELYDALAPALSSAGFTLVDTVSFAPRTHKVWRASASNVFGVAWYLDVVYEATGGANVWFVPFESYNATTHLAFRGPVNYYEGLITADGSASGATGYPLEDNHWWNPGYLDRDGQPVWLTTVVGENMAYWASITADRIAAMVSHDGQVITYAGLFKSSPIYQAAAGVNHFPLVMGRISTNPYSSDYLCITRWPNTTAVHEVLPLLPTDNYPDVARLVGIGVKEALGGVVLASDVWLGTWGGWMGSFYGIGAVRVEAPWDSDGFDDRYGGGMGAVVETNQTEGSVFPNAEWVLSAPRYWSGDYALMLKKV